MEGRVVLDDLEPARGERAAPHLVGQCARVRPVHGRAAHRPDHAQEDTEDDHAAGTHAEDVQREQDRAGGPDRDGDADALYDRLDRETLAHRDDLERRVHRRAGRPVGEDDVGDAGHPNEREEPERRGARPGDDEGHRREKHGNDHGVQHQPDAQPEASHQRSCD